MSSVGLKSVVYHGDSCLGEVHVYPAQTPAFKFPNHEIRIARLSHPSERCLPLSVLLTISPFAVRCKIESASPADHSPLSHLHSSCFSELKTAVVVVGDEELHLVAMQSGKVEKLPCFWCCSVPPGLYDSCLGMLNMRCLAIVFDLDETLIVANTMKSFEDRMEFLQRRIACEADPLRVSGMKAELKRYLDDKALLKQYAENDHVMENGKLLKAQFEEIPSMSNNQNQNRVLRPIIRLLEKNIVLTRINPEIRDTSVLVKLRPAWEDLRSYLIAKGRKRFEVYVCTMAERDYALEMWRLLDPEAHLISSKQLADRIICVKSGSRKSLLNVCQDGSCHPKMAMVIDDRLNVWDDCDQPRVHVVPAFAPYYAPQAEMANAVPVLCVARNVACNVRGGFFKEFDETLLRKVYELRYEDQIEDLPAAPDVSSYLMSEDTGAVPNGNGNRDVIMPEGMSGAEIERRLNQQDPKVGILDPPSAFSLNNVDMKSDLTRQPMASSIPRPPLMPRPATPVQGPGLLGAAPREGEIIQSELERRRFLALQHGQDMRNRGLMDPPLVPRSPIPITTLPQRHGGWLVMEDNNTGLLSKRSAGVTREPDALHIDKTQIVANSSHHHTDTAVPSGQFLPMSAVKAEEASVADGRDRQPNSSSAHSSSDDEFSRVPLGNGDACVTAQASAVSIEVLQEIGKRCKSKVEFRFVDNSSKDLQFSAEILFTGEKIGSGTGRTRKEAQLLAADNALHYLANKYVSHVEQDSAFNDGKKDNSSMQGENGFLRHITSSAVDELIEKKTVAPLSTCEQMERLDECNRLSAVISGINDMCVSGGLTPIFQDQPSVSVTVNEGEYYYQVEIDGQVVGKGTGLSKEAAKLQAAEAALVSLKSMVNQQNTKRLCSPRSGQNLPAKRTKDEVA